MNCNHDCSSCGGCAKSLYLTQGELDLLNLLSQTPFLPVGRKPDGELPVFLEADDYSQEQYSAILLNLEAKGLIDLDYKLPLGGFDYAAYQGYPVHGSFALTAKGQSVLDALAQNGITD